MKKYLILGMTTMLTLILVGCVNTESNLETNVVSSNNESLSSGKIEVVVNNIHDWGDINIMGGDVEKTFKLRNAGTEDLVVESASTSCMCTSAEVILSSGEKSPKFGMHNNESWNEAVAAGQEFEVSVVFDPLAHGPNATGQIMRIVTLETSGGDVELTVQGNVLSEVEFNKNQ